jgi:aspartyl/asparaginyl-tRNA synthetase
MEVAWIESHADIMDMEERWLAHALAAVAAAHGNEIKRVFDVEITIPTLPFPRFAFADALAMLEAAGAPPPKADDLDSESAASRRWSPPSAATSSCLSPTIPRRAVPSITCATKTGRL